MKRILRYTCVFVPCALLSVLTVESVRLFLEWGRQNPDSRAAHVVAATWKSVGLSGNPFGVK